MNLDTLFTTIWIILLYQPGNAKGFYPFKKKIVFVFIKDEYFKLVFKG